MPERNNNFETMKLLKKLCDENYFSQPTQMLHSKRLNTVAENTQFTDKQLLGAIGSLIAIRPPPDITARLNELAQKENIELSDAVLSAINTKVPQVFGLFNPISADSVLPLVGSLRRRPLDNLIFKVEDISQLLNSKDCIKEMLGGSECKVLRFMVRTNGDIVFAPEGPADNVVPAHTHMISDDNDDFRYCLAAGNIYFDSQDRVCQINNKSGDYKPPFDTLQFVIPALIRANVPTNESLTITDALGVPKGKIFLDASRNHLSTKSSADIQKGPIREVVSDPVEVMRKYKSQISLREEEESSAVIKKALN